MESASAVLERQVRGFKACFGGEELKRASATLAAGVATSANWLAQAWTSRSSNGGVAAAGAEAGGGATPPTPAARSAEVAADLPVRELMCESRLYTADAALSAPSFDALYSHGLVLQELATKMAPRSADELLYLQEACDKYEAALRLRPDSHAALYNLGVALSDQSRALRAGGDAEGARGCLHLASLKYALAVDAQPCNPQALNNWGLVLQELSAEAPEGRERDDLVGAALHKFRCAVRLRPDFDRGCYNLGTVCHAYASTLQSELSSQPKGAAEQPSRLAREAAVRVMFSTAAQYICLAWALQQQKDVYRKSLGMVKQLLPLPFLRAGQLLAPLPATLGTVDEAWERTLFVLDHQSLRCATPMESSLSAASTGLVVASQSPPPRGGPAGGKAATPFTPAGSGGEQPLVLGLRDIVAVKRCSDPTLPPGEAFWVSLDSDPQGVYLVADTAEAADAWVDALLLCRHIVHTRSTEALAEALAPLGHHSHHHHHAAQHHPGGQPGRRGH